MSTPHTRLLTALSIAFFALTSSGCTAISVATTVVGTTVSVATTAVNVGVAVGSTAVNVTTSAVKGAANVASKLNEVPTQAPVQAPTPD